MTNKKLKQLIVSLAVIIPLLGTFGTIYILDLTSPIQPIEQPEEEKTTYEIHKEIEDAKKPSQETVEKTWTNGNVTINYAVIVENGVEATPLPSVMEAMQNSYTPGEQKMIADFTKTIIFDRYGKFKETFLKNQMYYSLTNHQKLKQEYIDKTFSCDNYGQLAEQFDRFSLAGHGYSGTAENYIYTKALDECLSPKHQEEIDKVYAELEEVNKTNDE